MNSLSRELLAALNKLVTEISVDKSVRVVVITGAGEKSFCSGADLKERATMTPLEVKQYIQMIRNTFTMVENLPQPVIAAVNGFAFGGGTELALASDIRIAAANATMGLTETSLGIIPGAGGTQRLVRLIGKGKAKEMVFTAHRAKAEEYLQLLDRHFRQKWERYWVDLPNGAGAYTFTGNPTERFPGYLLPHNQYLALGRTWLVLQAVPGVPQREVYRDRAAKMARYFKRHLRLNGEAYLWNYWDPRPGENIRRHPEDVSHATIDIGFAVEACQRGIVFTPQDLRRFARTFTEVMWNGSWENPLFGRNVSTNEGGKRAFWEWAKLSLWDERVWQVAQAAFLKMGQPPNLTPTLLYLLAKRKGIPPSEKERWLQLRKKQ